MQLEQEPFQGQDHALYGVVYELWQVHIQAEIDNRRRVPGQALASSSHG